MTTGHIFAVVGPSGAGKDSLIDAAITARPGLVWARRVITRPSSAGGEPFEGVSIQEFAHRKSAGQFVLDWHAHDLSYGIPMSICDDLASGKTVIFNGSRAALSKAQESFAGLRVVVVTASPAVLAQRLAARGREADAQIAARLARPDFAIPTGLVARVVVNDGTFEQGVAAFLGALQPVRS